MPSAEARGVRLEGEPACQYTIISEASDTRGNATTWAKGDDGYWYRCIQAVDGRRVWTRFPPESEWAAGTILRTVAPSRRHKHMKFSSRAY
ncbi:MAG TPA: hypothetical protein VFF64_03015 [Candidatus Eremiobacteraceae bacterium]|nr:hypothetical protein [Candidatus Eremiobacteraceae bacterium]